MPIRKLQSLFRTARSTLRNTSLCNQPRSQAKHLRRNIRGIERGSEKRHSSPPITAAGSARLFRRLPVRLFCPNPHARGSFPFGGRRHFSPVPPLLAFLPCRRLLSALLYPQTANTDDGTPGLPAGPCQNSQPTQIAHSKLFCNESARPARSVRNADCHTGRNSRNLARFGRLHSSAVPSYYII